MKRKIVLPASVIAIGLLLAVFILKKPQPDTFILQRIDVDYKILASCTVSYPDLYDITAKTEGDVLSVPVREAQLVKKGDLLIQLDDFKEKQNLTIASNNYENAKLKLKNAKEETYPRLNEQLNDASAGLKEAQNQAGRMQALYASGSATKVELENAVTKLDAAQARYNQTKLQLDAYARSGAAAELINQLNILNAQVELARRALADKKMIAPYDCTIIKIDIQAGETLAVGKKAITVLEKQAWVLETNVDQKEVSFLEVGLPCFVVFDAYPGEKVKANISLVCTAIDGAKGTCNLKLQVQDNKTFIKHGMTGNAEIAGKKIAGVNVAVLALPSKYILHEKEGNFVLVKTGHKIEKKTLEYTPIGEKWVSVQNLAAGTVIALAK